MKADNIKSGPIPPTDILETVSLWKDDLQTRLQRAQLRQELIGLDPDEIATLGAEAAEFNRLVAVLKGVINA